MTDYEKPIYQSRLKREWKLYKIYQEEVRLERKIRADAAEINIIMDNAIEKMSEAHHGGDFSYLDNSRLDDYINLLIDIREKAKHQSDSVKRGDDKEIHSHKNVDKIVSKELHKAREVEKKLLKLIHLN